MGPARVQARPPPAARASWARAGTRRPRLAPRATTRPPWVPAARSRRRPSAWSKFLRLNFRNLVSPSVRLARKSSKLVEGDRCEDED
jgi:hypothetical protein